MSMENLVVPEENLKMIGVCFKETATSVDKAKAQCERRKSKITWDSL